MPGQSYFSSLRKGSIAMGRGWLAVCILFCVFFLTNSMMECEERDKKDMVQNFINCTGEHKNEYNRVMEQDNVEVENATCDLVTSLVDTCGELWGLCHSREEVRKMKARQVESLVLKNSESEVDIEKCLVVSKYRYVHCAFRSTC